jgi:hypothetical protein
MANDEDLAAARDLVEDATRVLDWSAGPEALLVNEAGEQVHVVPIELIESYREAVDQARKDLFDVALQTLRGENVAFTRDQVLEALDRAGWTGPMREFKLRAVLMSGRPLVMEVAVRGRARGGSISGGIFRRFLTALNAALGSLGAVPGVDGIREMKEFLESILFL